MTTDTAVKSLADTLDEANPNTLAEALRRVKLGTLLTPTKKTFTALTGAASHDITNAAHGNCAPILAVISLRVTTVGAAVAGPRVVTDVGGTPLAPYVSSSVRSAGIATLSNDGKTLLFENTVTGFILEYIPRSAADVTADFEPAPS